MSPRRADDEPRPHTYYGDPNEPLEDIANSEDLHHRPHGPEVGDELCDGHQAHYEWNGTDWGAGPLDWPITERRPKREK